LKQEVVVLVPIYGLTDELPQLIDSLASSSDPRVSRVLIDDFSQDVELDLFLKSTEEKYPKKFRVFRNQTNLGYLQNVNTIIDLYQDCDVLVINSDVIVTEDLPSSLLDLSEVDNTVATISIWASNGSILTVDVRDLDPKRSVKLVNSEISILKGNLLTIPVAVGHVIYYRRAALNVVGKLDEEFHPGYGEEVDYSLRAVRFGFRNVLSEGHFAYHSGEGSFQKIALQDFKRINDQTTIRKFPDYLDYLRSFEHNLIGAKRRFEIALFGFSLGVDASSLNYPASGTTSITIEILRQLSRQHKGTVTAIIDRKISPENLKALLDLDSVSVQYLEDLIQTSATFDILWRPYQIWEEWRLYQTRRLAAEYVLGIQDLIGFDNYHYHDSISTWSTYRKVMRLAANLATGLTFISNYSRNRALETGLLTTQSVRVIPNGITGDVDGVDISARKTISNLQSMVTILLVGMNFEHKYFMYAFKIAGELATKGLQVRILRIGHGEVSAPNDSEIDFKDLGEVSDETRNKLYAEVTFVLYPSTVEGFGLIPFEAAKHGVFCFATRQGGLNEYLPKDIPTIAEWNPKNDVRQILEALPKIDEYTKLIQDHNRLLTWSKNVSLHYSFFQELLFVRTHQGIISGLKDFNLPSQAVPQKYWKVMLKHKILVFSLRILPLGSMSRNIVKRLIGKH
jgi:GT2 family glycosyltransferase